MNILITGHEGFIGNSLLKKLKTEENRIIGFGRGENLSRRKFLAQPDVFIKGEIRDEEKLKRVIADYEINEVYHFAAQSIVRTCANNPKSTFDINVMGTVALLEACRTSGPTVNSVVISTSDKAFGHGPIPYTEESPLKPLHAYETSKACQQLASLCYFHNFGVPAKVVACSNLYGPGDFNMTRIIPNTITRLAKGKPALLNKGAASYVRELVYIDDAVDAFITASRKGKNGEVYCCGGTEHLSIEKLIEKICHIMEKDVKNNLQIFERPSQFKEIKEQYIDSTKLQSLGWKPKYSLDEGLKKTIEWYTNLSKK